MYRTLIFRDLYISNQGLMDKTGPQVGHLVRESHLIFLLAIIDDMQRYGRFETMIPSYLHNSEKWKKRNVLYVLVYAQHVSIVSYIHR